MEESFFNFVKICRTAAYILYMELSFQGLKQKDVISVNDGKNLGKVSDISVSFPECSWLGLTVPGCKGFRLTNKRELFIPVNWIVQIGEDAILVRTEQKPPLPPPSDKCPPPKDKCPPPCPPPKPRPRQNYPDNFQNNPDRRDYGEYE